MEWIDCKKSNPPFDEKILISTIGGVVREAYLRRWKHAFTGEIIEAFEDEHGEVFTFYPWEVSHWMPMPAPANR